jgi:hypothetical protein
MDHHHIARTFPSSSVLLPSSNADHPFELHPCRDPVEFRVCFEAVEINAKRVIVVRGAHVRVVDQLTHKTDIRLHGGGTWCCVCVLF